MIKANIIIIYQQYEEKKERILNEIEYLNNTFIKL